ncbi:unnamed protein product [Moneuplotes crassus]|uniref:Hcy-binding domain-containing protein n=1 Tax=Euplotes crassus TaxID=5936 RepID=A0AAD1XN99_EUPCR|nr:unnamed protein product [Moneuplotes crassus]
MEEIQKDLVGARLDHVQEYLHKIFSKRVVVIDGAMGTSIQQALKQGVGQEVCENKEFCRENLDMMNITNPEVIQKIHTDFIEAGSDIICTNTFNSQKISQQKYGMEDKVFEMNFQGAKIAREVADELSAPDKWILVAGSIGPTTINLSLQAEDSDIKFEDIKQAYKEQIDGLVQGGCNVILFETIVDLKNFEAGYEAFKEYFTEHSLEKPPLFVSGTPIIDGK